MAKVKAFDRSYWPRWTIGLLMLMVLGVPMLMRPDDASDAAIDAPSLSLVIVSPHNEQIRYEFSRGFNAWRESRGEKPIVFDWRSSGGTSDLRKQVLSEFEAAAINGRENEGIGKDIFFGGGEYELNVLARGVSVDRGGKTVRISATLPLGIDAPELAMIYPSPTIGGERLYHPQGHWYGAALSSFGIVYNRDVLDMLEVEEPTTWADLQNPQLRGWVALADPGHSGSIAATYDAILRRYGWGEGWRVLRRVFANARYFTSSASKVPVDVSAGEAAAGMAIDFYGRYQAGAVGGDRVGYVDPPGMTTITADPIGILRGAPHPALAREFVLWVLSREGQMLWQKQLGTIGGPEQFELRRLPARKDVYQPQHMVLWTDQVNPFEIAKPLPPGMPSFYTLIAPVTRAMAIDVHDDLRKAWATMVQTDDFALRTKMERLFEAMPKDLQVRWPDQELEASWQTILEMPNHARHAEVVRVLENFVREKQTRWQDQDVKLSDQRRWSEFFQDNYRAIIAMGQP